MTDRKLMQQALDALEDSCYPRMSTKHSVRYDEIVTALRERLAQPEHHDPISDAQDKLIVQTAAIALAHKVKVYEDALGEIAWSNDSEWQQDRAKQVLAQMRGVEL